MTFRQILRVVGLFAGLFMIIMIILALRPVPLASHDNSVFVSGTLDDVFEGVGYDVIFRLEGDPRRYYVNRGVESGLEVLDLRQSYLGQPIELAYIRHWTPLDPNGTVLHLSQVSAGDSVIYSEIR